MKYLFDTEAFMAMFNGEKGSHKVQILLDEIERGKTEGCISAVTLTEIYYKYAQKDEKLATQRIDSIAASKLKVINLDSSMALKAGKYKLSSIPLADAIIAAAANEQRAHIVTSDNKHFKHLGLNVINYR